MIMIIKQNKTGAMNETTKKKKKILNAKKETYIGIY